MKTEFFILWKVSGESYILTNECEPTPEKTLVGKLSTDDLVEMVGVSGKLYPEELVKVASKK